MSDEFEAWITVKGIRKGQRYAERKPLNVPVDLATGQYENLSDLQVREFIKDLRAEEQRRRELTAHRVEVAEKCGGWDPFAAVIRRAA